MRAVSIALAATRGDALAAAVAIELATGDPAGRRQLQRGRKTICTTLSHESRVPSSRKYSAGRSGAEADICSVTLRGQEVNCRVHGRPGSAGQVQDGVGVG
jgi:hypothetical protein